MACIANDRLGVSTVVWGSTFLANERPLQTTNWEPFLAILTSDLFILRHLIAHAVLVVVMKAQGTMTETSSRKHF